MISMLSEMLWYLQCITTGGTTVLHWIVNIVKHTKYVFVMEPLFGVTSPCEATLKNMDKSIAWIPHELKI